MRREAGPLGRAGLGRLVKEYGYETVAEWLREMAPAKRKRGRPPGPKSDDTRLAQAAAVRWRQAGRPNKVWRALLEAGGSDSVAVRLLYRLDEWGAEGCAERHIADFRAALEAARNKRFTDKMARQIAARLEGVTPGRVRQMLAAKDRVIDEALDRGERVCLRGFGTYYVGPDGHKRFRPGKALRATGARVPDSSAAREIH
jgi:nucleoid DNA-binding protein